MTFYIRTGIEFGGGLRTTNLWRDQRRGLDRQLSTLDEHEPV